MQLHNYLHFSDEEAKPREGNTPPQSHTAEPGFEPTGHSTSQGCLEEPLLRRERGGKAMETKGSAYARASNQVPFNSSSCGQQPLAKSVCDCVEPRCISWVPNQIPSHSGDEDGVFLVSSSWQVTSSLTAYIAFVTSWSPQTPKSGVSVRAAAVRP